jgi:hypothetical protein
MLAPNCSSRWARDELRRHRRFEVAYRRHVYHTLYFVDLEPPSFDAPEGQRAASTGDW